jgi:hypothetical protein
MTLAWWGSLVRARFIIYRPLPLNRRRHNSFRVRLHQILKRPIRPLREAKPSDLPRGLCNFERTRIPIGKT